MYMLLSIGFGLFTAGSNIGYSIKSDISNYVKNSGYPITVILKDTLHEDLSFLDKLPFVTAVTHVNILTGNSDLKVGVT